MSDDDVTAVLASSSPSYGPPVYGPPGRTTRETVGKVLTVLASVVGPPAAVVAAFIGSIVWSDCFLSCGGDPDHLSGGLLLALAAMLLLAAPVLAATLVRRRAWLAGACAVPVVEALLVAAGLAH